MSRRLRVGRVTLAACAVTGCLFLVIRQDRLNAALLAAANRGDGAAFQALVREGANPRVRDRRGRTAPELLEFRQYIETDFPLRGGSGSMQMPPGRGGSLPSPPSTGK
jgi:hypothetical protein